MSTDTTTNAGSTSIIEEGIVRDDRGSVHEKAVLEIVGMIRSKFEDEAVRNFAIGKRAFEHAQWQRGNFPGYTGSDFDTLMRRIRDDVRLYVAVKADSIRVDDWVRCHVLRELVRELDGDAIAESLSMHEYNRLIGKALSFDKKNVEGSLVPGWIDLIRGVASERIDGLRVTAAEFTERIDANVKRLASAAKTTDPVKAATEESAKALTQKVQDVSKATQAVAKAVNDALGKGHLDPTSVMGIVELASKELKKPLPAQFGFNPATCTKEDCELLASTMWKAGKYAEMKFLADRLGKMVAAVDKARETAQVVLPIEPDAAKLAREQKKAERKLAKTGL